MSDERKFGYDPTCWISRFLFITAFDRGKRQGFSMAFGGYRLHDYAMDWLHTSRSSRRVSFTLYMIGMEIRVNRMRLMIAKMARRSAH